MAFASVHTTGQTFASAATNQTITLSSASTIGNVLIANITIFGTGITLNSVTDSGGNTWALAQSALNSNRNIYQYYGVQLAGSTTVTAHYSVAAADTNIIIDEFSGGQSTNAAIFDKASTGVTGTVQTATVTSFAPASGELISAGVCINSAGTGFSAGASYTIANSSLSGSATEYRLSSSTSETAPISWTSTAVTYAEVAGAYIASGGGGAPTIIYRPYIPPFLN